MSFLSYRELMIRISLPLKATVRSPAPASDSLSL